MSDKAIEYLLQEDHLQGSTRMNSSGCSYTQERTSTLYTGTHTPVLLAERQSLLPKANVVSTRLTQHLPSRTDVYYNVAFRRLMILTTVGHTVQEYVY